eukprot:TRINITY_DN48543_c0_g1_i1.p1 TRINITY_DN48543_c0_g1~~TRINITY_DN48543_c0_g1_i1.p1  ORF type:complete len:785 (-),score=122.13 TRINITY_DN48543_c0_g1_i1:111-2426(-)
MAGTFAIRPCPFAVLCLGVDSSVTSSAIESAWRRRSLDCHPDKRPHDPLARAKFQALSDAKQCLLDPVQRGKAFASAVAAAATTKATSIRATTHGKTASSFGSGGRVAPRARGFAPTAAAETGATDEHVGAAEKPGDKATTAPKEPDAGDGSGAKRVATKRTDEQRARDIFFYHLDRRAGRTSFQFSDAKETLGRPKQRPRSASFPQSNSCDVSCKGAPRDITRDTKRRRMKPSQQPHGVKHQPISIEGFGAPVDGVGVVGKIVRPASVGKGGPPMVAVVEQSVASCPQLQCAPLPSLVDASPAVLVAATGATLAEAKVMAVSLARLRRCGGEAPIDSLTRHSTRRLQRLLARHPRLFDVFLPGQAGPATVLHVRLRGEDLAVAAQQSKKCTFGANPHSMAPGTSSGSSRKGTRAAPAIFMAAVKRVDGRVEPPTVVDVESGDEKEAEGTAKEKAKTQLVAIRQRRPHLRRAPARKASRGPPFVKAVPGTIMLVTESEEEDKESVVASTDVSASEAPLGSLLGTAFAHACGEWTSEAVGGKRFLLVTGSALNCLYLHRVEEAVLFAYEVRSKVLFEYVPREGRCVVRWTPAEPAMNAAIWTVLPLPPADESTKVEDVPSAMVPALAQLSPVSSTPHRSDEDGNAAMETSFVPAVVQGGRSQEDVLVEQIDELIRGAASDVGLDPVLSHPQSPSLSPKGWAPPSPSSFCSLVSKRPTPSFASSVASASSLSPESAVPEWAATDMISCPKLPTFRRCGVVPILRVASRRRQDD